MKHWLCKMAITGLILVLPALVAAASTPVAQTSPTAEPEEPGTLQTNRTQAISRYRDVITRLEDEGGAYNPALTEPLLELGMALQQSGMHAEAIDLLKRGVHLARINNGLYSEIQLALLESEIKSHLALGQFEEADDRHRYLYRVQQRTLTDAGRGFAFMQQAKWQRRAYELELDENGFNRLINMWNLHRMALTEFAEADGDGSPTLLPPLHGMLRAQYLMSGSMGENSAGRFQRAGFRIRGDDEGRLYAYRGQSYKQGDSVIRAIFDVRAAQADSTPLARAEVLAMMGDWRLWHGRYTEALDAYAEAIIELASVDGAEEGLQTLFGAPVALPALEGIRPLPEPASPDTADLLLEFTVDERGRVRDLTRLDDSEASVGIVNRIMRTLRATPFRPRFDTGEPVATTGIQWAYDTDQWQ
ncbi:hypothetical protein [Chromatocurvus halotolerans]|uniref:TonB family protein n=1 Tax=Chromatocurvus halotolerans TaxID=1132028 RepID=A0A4R2L653_9GAMM|nr:hypothetical protein [Chromatocurvus halotolerans]TCO74665.1 hypothetical protein EV688_11224 [Chromatocurvus halotolerans]